MIRQEIIDMVQDKNILITIDGATHKNGWCIFDLTTGNVIESGSFKIKNIMNKKTIPVLTRFRGLLQQNTSFNTLIDKILTYHENNVVIVLIEGYANKQNCRAHKSAWAFTSVNYASMFYFTLFTHLGLYVDMMSVNEWKGRKNKLMTQAELNSMNIKWTTEDEADAIGMCIAVSNILK